MSHFHPVFRHFFLEQFPDPSVWFEKRLRYTRSVASASIGKEHVFFGGSKSHDAIVTLVTLDMSVKRQEVRI